MTSDIGTIHTCYTQSRENKQPIDVKKESFIIWLAMIGLEYWYILSANGRAKQVADIKCFTSALKSGSAKGEYIGFPDHLHHLTLFCSIPFLKNNLPLQPYAAATQSEPSLSPLQEWPSQSSADIDTLWHQCRIIRSACEPGNHVLAIIPDIFICGIIKHVLPDHDWTQ